MKKAKKGIAGLLSMALVLGCLGSLPASANANNFKCTSTVDENGVIHTQIILSNDMTFIGTYSPTYSDITKKKFLKLLGQLKFQSKMTTPNEKLWIIALMLVICRTIFHLVLLC